MKISTQSDSAGGTRWIKRAKRLAASINNRFGIKHGIIDGYLLEGARSGRNRRARVVDPPSYIFVRGPATTVSYAEDDAQELVRVVTGVPVPIRRDLLHWDYSAGSPPSSDRLTGGIQNGALAGLRRRAPETVSTFFYNRWDHGATPAPCGLYYGLTFSRPGPGVGTRRLKIYRTPETPTFSVFMLYPADGLHLEAAVEPSEESLRNSQTPWVGLDIDNEWVEQYLGAGQVIMDYAPGGILFASNDQWSEDSLGSMYQYAWVHGDVISRDVEGGSLVWRVVARVTTPPASERDFWGSRYLVVFDVATQRVDGVPTATPLGVVSTYNPAGSADPTRVPLELDGEYKGFERNSFAPPIKACKGVMIIPQVCRNGATGEMNDNFNVLLLDRSGHLIELDLPADAGRSKCWFAGGDEVEIKDEDGEVISSAIYMINPFLTGERMAVVTESGGVSIVSRPAWNMPLQSGVSSRMAEDHLRGMVSHIGGGKLGFLVADVSGSNVFFATYNVLSGEFGIGGLVWSTAQEYMMGGYGRIGVVQAETKDRPAILLTGYNVGIMDGSNTVGVMGISYDSGATWKGLSSVYGPSRGIAAMGSAIKAAEWARFWE